MSKEIGLPVSAEIVPTNERVCQRWLRWLNPLGKKSPRWRRLWWQGTLWGQIKEQVQKSGPRLGITLGQRRRRLDNRWVILAAKKKIPLLFKMSRTTSDNKDLFLITLAYKITWSYIDWVEPRRALDLSRKIIYPSSFQKCLRDIFDYKYMDDPMDVSFRILMKFVCSGQHE